MNRSGQRCINSLYGSRFASSVAKPKMTAESNQKVQPKKVDLSEPILRYVHIVY